jgi:hypothetical protein
LPVGPYALRAPSLPEQSRPSGNGPSREKQGILAASPKWCNVVNYQRLIQMKKNAGGGKTVKTQSATPVRASISFPPDLYETLEEIAKQKKVSLAWVVRDAAEQYIADRKWPSGAEPKAKNLSEQ